MSWSIVSGALPTGLRLNPSTGQLSGTPTTLGTSTFTIRVQDSSTPQQSDQKSFSLTVERVLPPDGTLTVSNAPHDVGGMFVADPRFTVSGALVAGLGFVEWGEAFTQNITTETVQITFNSTTGEILSANFISTHRNTSGRWLCGGAPFTPCSGGTVNRAAGTASFPNMALPLNGGSTSPITLNGTLRFTPS